MKMPFMDHNSSKCEKNYDNRSRFFERDNPFDGSTEMDIRTLTERVLDDDRNIGYVTSEGQVMPRNTAFEQGYRDGIELVKQRVWGGTSYMEERGDVLESSVPPLEAEDVSFSPAGGRVSVNIVFSEAAKQSILHESLESKDTETGGALIGAWKRDLEGRISIYVARATGPGPNATRQMALFSPNLDYYRSRIGYYREIHNWDYLGEWHKHPGSFDSLSSVDIATARTLIREEGWPMLLLPIVNITKGQVFLENNVILSPQLGGQAMMHINTEYLDNVPLPSSVEVYLDAQEIDKFRKGGAQETALDGICNAGESYVFIPFPGPKNAELRLVKDCGREVAFSGRRNVVTAVVGEENVRCYHVFEGEIRPLEHIVIDPANSIYERNAGLTETSELRGKTVSLVGCGSLGSTMALSLARAGVGTFNLFDFDRLSPVNIARHQASLGDLGRSKAAVLRDLIHRINPTIAVSVNDRDVVNTVEGFQTFKDAAVMSDLLICTTDTDDSRLLVNNVAVELGIEAIQAGLHERAASGLVHVYVPSSGHACFACHHNRVLSESSKRAEGIAYSDAKDIRDLTVQPGLAAQINVIAEVGALRAIDVLMGSNSLPDLTLVYIDSSLDDAEKEQTAVPRRLNLRVCHLDMERSLSCAVCGSGEEKGEAADDGDRSEFGDLENMEKCQDGL